MLLTVVESTKNIKREENVVFPGTLTVVDSGQGSRDMEVSAMFPVKVEDEIENATEASVVVKEDQVRSKCVASHFGKAPMATLSEVTLNDLDLTSHAH